MKRTLLLSALLIPLLVRASGVAALGDIACGIYTNTATNGIPYVENEWLDSVWTPSWPPDVPWWYSTNGFVLANAAPNDNAALVSGQLKWAFLCAANELEAATGAAGGAGSPVWWKIWSFPVNDNDRTVSTAELLDTFAPLVERLRVLYVDSLVYSLPELPHEAYWPGASNAPVALKHLKHALVFDPHYDSDQDGIPDWWERYMVLDSWSGYGSVLPGDDPDFDGLTNLQEYESGSDPLDRDTDGDGLVDGVDPDPRSWTDAGDYDHDGIPDSLELHWFGGTDAVPFASNLNWNGFPFAMATAAGICPTNPAPEAVFPSDGLSSLLLVPRFGIETNAGECVWSCNVLLERHGAWEQYFLSTVPDPLAAGSAAPPFALEGLALEWGDSAGNGGTFAFPSGTSAVHLPASIANEWEDGVRLSFSLWTTNSGLATCSSPLYLLSYTPAIEFSGIPSAVAGDALLSAAAKGSDVGFSIDWSNAPGPIAAPGDGSDELFFDSLGADSVSFVRGMDGRITGGTLHGVHAGLFEIPFIAPPPAPPLRSVLPLPPSVHRFLLAVLDPRLTYGNGHGPDAAGLAWDGLSYSLTHD